MPSPVELLLLLALGAARAAGTELPQAPSVAPGAVARPAGNVLALARERWNQGDAAGTVAVLGPWLDNPKAPPLGRERTAGHLLLGTAWMELERWNLASAQFSAVKAGGEPLAAWGAWYEALVDHARGRHQVAIGECASYRERYPDGLHADECLVLMGEAHAAMGRPGAAVSAFQAWLNLHPDSPRAEEIELGKALAVARSDPDAGIPMLQELLMTHSFPSTAVGATQALAQLHAEGHASAVLPSDTRSRMRHAESLRRSGKLFEAWDLFLQLSQEAAALGEDGRPRDPGLAAWVQDNEDRFAWGTRQFDVFARNLRPEYDKNPSRALGWRIYKAYARGGLWAEGAPWAAQMMETWGGGETREEVAWAFVHAGRFAEARERWLDLAGKGKGNRRARFLAAFCALRDGQLEPAIEELGALSDEGGADAAAAAFWRSRAHGARAEEELRRQWEQKAIELDVTGWYRMLVEDRRWREAGAPTTAPVATNGTVSDAWLLRDGTWKGHAPPTLVPPERAALPPPGTWKSQGPQEAALGTPAVHPGWAHLSWDGQLRSATTEALPSSSGALAVALPIGQEALPDGYGTCAFYDPASAEATFARVSGAWTDVLPDLPAAYDLARAGQGVDSGRILRAAWLQWDQAEGRTDPRSLRLRQIRMADWREMSIYAREPHLSYRLCYGLWKAAPTEEDELAGWRLGFPMVRSPELWHHGRTYGVDPFLMMGIMRQESTYQTTVVSHAGAIGLVQVMPRTGAKVAALLGEGRYSPRDLEDPETNLRYGSYYMSLLLKRFDGVYPLAVASYNGGPFNVSRWLATWHGRGEQIDLAAFVEQIQYDESRDYVKKVSGYYSTYVRLYGPAGARVVIPPHPLGDDARVVDF